jgi:hypothetical protein
LRILDLICGVQSKPKTSLWRKKYRIKTETRLAKFKDLQDRLDERQGKYSDQATFQFMLELAHAKLQELEEKDQEIQELSSEV